MNFTRFVDIAKALKLTNQTGRCFHCAFAVKQKKIVCIGINRYNKTNRISATFKPKKVSNCVNFVSGIHAEIDLLGKMKRVESFSQYQLVSLRINNENELDNACPCPSCAFNLGQVDFKRIWYSTKSGFERFP